MSGDIIRNHFYSSSYCRPSTGVEAQKGWEVMRRIHPSRRKIAFRESDQILGFLLHRERFDYAMIQHAKQGYIGHVKPVPPGVNAIHQIVIISMTQLI